MGLASKAALFTGAMESIGPRAFSSNESNQFIRLEQFAKLKRPTEVKFKDLAEVVSHKISVNLLPFEVRADFIKVTSDTVLVPVTLQIKNRDITFNHKEGVAHGVVNIFGRVTTLTGRIAQTFEDTVIVDQPDELLSKALESASVYWKALPLRPGRYRLDLVAKDVNSDRVGTWSKGILVPQYEEDKLASSSLIVADLMEKVPTKNVGAGNFVIGTTKVRPRMEGGNGRPATFNRAQKANFWMQVYNLAVDQQTHKPSATIEYEVTSMADNKPVVQVKESTAEMGNVGEQITLEKSLPLDGFKPGVYQIAIKVRDNVSNQHLAQSARFAVE